MIRVLFVDAVRGYLPVPRCAGAKGFDAGFFRRAVF